MSFLLKNPGWYIITNEEHHSQAAISSTGLKMFCQSPNRYYHKYVKRDWHSDSYSSAFLIGTCVHMFLLEPERAEMSIAYTPERSTTKKYKEFVLERFHDVEWDHPQNSAGRFMTTSGSSVYVVSESVYEQIWQMVKCAHDHKTFMALANSAEKESSGFVKYGDDWLSCRGDLRGERNGFGYFVDIKTIDNINEYALQSQLFSLGYHIQHLHYLHVANLIEDSSKLRDEPLYKAFYFFFIEKSFPHECRLVHLDMSPEESRILQTKYLEKLHELQKCRKNNQWQSSETCGRIRVPGWVLDRLI